MYYPIFIPIAGQPCLVVGGGKVAHQKVSQLVRFGARVTVVSPAFSPSLRRLRSVQRIQRLFCPKDLTGAVLVFSATNDSALNQRVFRLCRQKKILVNVVDQPALCRFIVPSIIKKRKLVIAISTGGQSPALSKFLRKELDRKIPTSIAPFLQWIGRQRQRVRRTIQDPKTRLKILNDILPDNLLGRLQTEPLSSLKEDIQRQLDTLLRSANL